MRHLWLAFLFLTLSRTPAICTETVADLNQAAPSVTGTGEAERHRGFREALKEVIIKLTGDASLQGSEQIKPLLELSPNFVASYTYEDEMKGIPIHDEQGTRDRPHKLTVTFDMDKLKPAMEAFGLANWPAERPITAVLLGIKDMRDAYVLSANGLEAYGQREVIKYVARQRGLPVILPDDPHKLNLTYEPIAIGDTEAMIAVAKALKADAVLYGALNFDGDAYWNITWTLVWWGHDLKTWTHRGVTFDVALRQALETAAKIYSAETTR